MVQPNPGAQSASPLTGDELIDILGLQWQTDTTAAVADTRKVTAAATATGTTRTDAYVLTTQITEFSSVPSGTGAVLPNTTKIGIVWTIYNDDAANALQVYAPGSQTIDGVAGATGVPLTHAKAAIFTKISATAWKSNLLGAVSS